MTMKSLIRCLMFLFCAMAALPAVAQKPVVKLTVTHQPEALSPGSPFVMTVTSAKSLLSLEARWADGHRILFSPDKKAKIWRGAGVVIPKSPGEHSLELTGKLKSGKAFLQPHALQIVEGEFPQELIISLPVPLTEIQSSGADPDDQPIPQLPEDSQGKRLQAAFTRLTLEPLWSGNFAEPLDQVKIIGKETSNFGEKIALRNFKPHRGEDMKADAGTAVKAMNSGIVVLAEEMRCEGRMIVLDHGQGWLSVYLHLSQLKVEINQRVTKEQVIALSGASGSCCHGAHLHVGVRWQTIYVNPADVLKLEWPMINAVRTPKPVKPAPKRSSENNPVLPEPVNLVQPVSLDFARHAPSALWHNQANGKVSLGCANADATNCMTVGDDIKLENGKTAANVIELMPEAGGTIAGTYTILTPLKPGDKFRAEIGFIQEAKDGNAIWRVLFLSKGGQRIELGRLDKIYNSSLLPWEIDLSPYTGQKGKLVIEAINLSSSHHQNGICWVNPRIGR